jgi:hypothetical protein
LDPHLICCRILIEIPKQYDSITQACFQIDKSKLNLAIIKSKFAIEDSRNEASKIKVKEEKVNAATERTCSDCSKPLHPNARAYQTRCRNCQQKWFADKQKEEKEVENKEEKKEEKQNKTRKEEKKEKANIVLVF